MQQLMRKMGQRMIMVLIIALLLVNFVICNSIVNAAMGTQKMSIQEYLNMPSYNDLGQPIKHDLYSENGYAIKAICSNWNVSKDEAIQILQNHANDSETLTVTVDEGGVYVVNGVSIKLTESEKTQYGIATDSDGNASADTNPGTSDSNDEDDEEGGEDDGVGGILFRPIASLICGIGDTCNTLLQRLLIGEKSDVFISRRIFLKF